MPARYGIALFLVLCALFLAANRGAYESFFQDDEIDNIKNMRLTEGPTYVQALISPRFQTNNFRPVGHAYFGVMARRFGLDFPRYVAVIHAIHLLNVWLVWLVARRFGLGVWPACFAAALFAFHMAVFDVYWKPMYVFDLLCAAFSLSSILLYVRGRWLLSLAAFWLAYKSKELAVMLPAVLLVWEFRFGEKRWKRLIPFFAVSVMFGAQGILLNPNVDNDYTFRFTPAAVWRSVRFYSSQVLLLPFAGLGLAVLAWAVKDRAFRFGLAAMALFFVPLIFLPGRLFAAYCYVPLAGLALAAGAAAARHHAAFAAVFLLAWIPWNMVELRQKRRQALAAAAENRTYITTVGEFVRSLDAPIDSAVYDGAPEGFHRWGVEATLHYFTRFDLPVCKIDDPCLASALQAERIALFAWDPRSRKLLITRSAGGRAGASYVYMNRITPVWQLVSGWYPLEETFRWIEPVARAELERPASAREFEVVVNAGPLQLKDQGKIALAVSLNGVPLGTREFAEPGWQKARWPLPDRGSGPVTVEMRARSEYRPRGDSRRLGAAIVSFGFPQEIQRR